MLEVDSDLLGKMAHLGFVACRSAQLRVHAVAIFESLELERPQSPVPVIGMAMVRLNCDGSAEGAVSHMKGKGVSVEEGDYLSRAFLGFFLKMAKRFSEADEVLQRVVKDSDDGEATRLARAAIVEM